MTGCALTGLAHNVETTANWSLGTKLCPAILTLCRKHPRASSAFQRKFREIGSPVDWHALV